MVGPEILIATLMDAVRLRGTFHVRTIDNLTP
jgi:hypothetical protein